MAFAALELVVGLVALAALLILVWSLGVILITPEDTWKTVGLNQWMWLVVVIVMPVVGSVLFLVAARRRLRQGGAVSAPEEMMG